MKAINDKFSVYIDPLNKLPQIVHTGLNRKERLAEKARNRRDTLTFVVSEQPSPETLAELHSVAKQHGAKRFSVRVQPNV